MHPENGLYDFEAHVLPERAAEGLANLRQVLGGLDRVRALGGVHVAGELFFGFFF